MLSGLLFPYLYERTGLKELFSLSCDILSLQNYSVAQIFPPLHLDVAIALWFWSSSFYLNDSPPRPPRPTVLLYLAFTLQNTEAPNKIVYGHHLQIQKNSVWCYLLAAEETRNLREEVWFKFGKHKREASA